MVIVGAMAVLTIGLGVTAYGAHVRASTLPGMIVALVLGTAAFTTLGIGVTPFIHRRIGPRCSSTSRSCR